MANIKPHYLFAAMSRDKLSPDEVILLDHIDTFCRAIRSAEILNIGGDDRFTFIEKHVQAAYEYYSMFDMKDMASLAMLDELAAALKEKVDEE